MCQHMYVQAVSAPWKSLNLDHDLAKVPRPSQENKSDVSRRDTIRNVAKSRQHHAGALPTADHSCVRKASKVPEKMPVTMVQLMAMPATSRHPLSHSSGPNIMAHEATKPLLRARKVTSRKRPTSDPQTTEDSGLLCPSMNAGTKSSLKADSIHSRLGGTHRASDSAR
mmetsp:Transcript_57609/g.185022  ORF Transcript_57609/g.185022 Transcript_57609/m.185022 type:complete len:168 (-) Transcript_57609:1002-1505(-)